MKQIILVVLIISAIMTLQTQKMKNAVIYLGVFSIMIAFVYLLQGAPDVAIAEAVIGSTMTTILFVVALHKYKLFRIYINVDALKIDDKVYKNTHYKELLESINIFCYKKGLDPMPIYTVDVDDLVGKNLHHITLKLVDDCFELAYHKDDIKADELFHYLIKNAKYTNIKRKIY
jgi:uncharacterized MnhB-related membrane protein